MKIFCFGKRINHNQNSWKNQFLEIKFIIMPKIMNVKKPRKLLRVFMNEFTKYFKSNLVLLKMSNNF